MTDQINAQSQEARRDSPSQTRDPQPELTLYVGGRRLVAVDVQGGLYLASTDQAALRSARNALRALENKLATLDTRSTPR